MTTDWGSTVLHVVRVEGDSWLSSAEVSSMVKEWQGWDLLERRLKAMHLKLEKLVVDKGTDKWDWLVKGDVGGVKDKEGDWMEEVRLYKLDTLPQVLSQFTEKCGETASSLARLGKSLG